MPRKKKESTVDGEIAQEAAPEAEFVNVAMTEKEKEEFVKFKAAQLDEKALKSDPPKSKKRFQMNLGFRHNINGNSFGPGPSQVPEEWVGHIQAGEQAQIQQEMLRNNSLNRTYQIMQSGQAVPVAVRE